MAMYLRYAIIAACAIGIFAGCDAPATPQRHGVISFSPNITETIFALGEGDEVLAVTDFCDYPPEAAALPKVGGYINPSLEKLTMLQPALVILPGTHPKVSEYANQFGIPVLHAHMDNLQTIEVGIRSIGDALKCPDRADVLWKDMMTQLEAVRRAVAGKPRPTVFIINTRSSHDLNSLFTVGGTSFVSELVDVAGGENIFKKETEPYFEASKESVVLKQPDIILEFHAGENLPPEEQARFIADWNELPSLRAVQDGKVLLFLESYGLRPGPRIGQTARDLARMFHPDASVPQ